MIRPFGSGRTGARPCVDVVQDPETCFDPGDAVEPGVAGLGVRRLNEGAGRW